MGLPSAVTCRACACPWLIPVALAVEGFMAGKFQSRETRASFASDSTLKYGS